MSITEQEIRDSENARARFEAWAAESFGGSVACIDGRYVDDRLNMAFDAWVAGCHHGMKVAYDSTEQAFALLDKLWPAK